MDETGKKLVSHGSIYFFGNILRYMVSFVMLPIYTRILTPADYGTIELLSMVIDFAGIIFGLRIGEAIFRFYLMAESDIDKKNIISSALVLTVALNGVGFFILYLTSGLISATVFNGLEKQNLLIIFSLSLFFQPLVEIPMTYIRAQQLPWLFVFFSMLKLALQLSLNIYLVLNLRLGVLGVVLSAVVTGCLMSLLLGGYCFRRTGLQFSFSKAKKLVLFCYPMILASFFGFYVTFGDRFFLNHYSTLDEVGIYALGYKFGFLLVFIGINPFSAIWDSERYHVLKEPNAKSIFQNVFVFFAVFLLIQAVGISIFSKNILMVMANTEFWGAAKIVPIVVLAYFFQGLLTYCNFGILIHKKTFIITKSSVLAAVVITVLYFLLIPAFGAIGAAWATALTSFVKLLYIYFHATRLYDMELPWKKMFIFGSLSTLVVLISLFGPDQIVWSLIFNITVFYLFVYVFTLLPVLSKTQNLLLRELILKPWRFPSGIRSLLRTT